MANWSVSYSPCNRVTVAHCWAASSTDGFE